MQEVSDGGFIVAGYTVGNDGDVTENKGDRDYWIIKLDSEGELEWQKRMVVLTQTRPIP